jgi:hypothetical protein
MRDCVTLRGSVLRFDRSVGQKTEDGFRLRDRFCNSRVGAMQILASGAKGWNLPMKIEADRVYSEIVATA